MLCAVARATGFEPVSKVLETSILPLNYARVCSYNPGYKNSMKRTLI